MSGYALYFWEPPLPKNQDEAARIVEQLESRRCEQRPVFLELARRITARYPCSCSSDVAPWEDVWGDGPVDGQSDSPLYGLGLTGRQIEKVYPFVVEVARSLGLVTYDAGLEVVFLPSGEQFGDLSFDDEEEEQVEPRDDWPWDRDSFREIVRAEMEPFMRANGFVYNKAAEGYIRSAPSYRVSIQFVADTGTYRIGTIRLFACVVLKFDKDVEQRLKAAKKDLVMLVFDLSKLSNARMWEPGADAKQAYEYLNQSDIFWPAPTIGDLKTVLHEQILPFLAITLLPVMADCQSWGDLNALVNPEGEERRIFVKRGSSAILAYLVNDARREQIADDVKRTCRDVYAKRLLDYLSVMLHREPSQSSK